MSSKNTFVPTVFRHTLIYAASRKLAPLALRQCFSGKAKYIEKPLHSLSFFEDISTNSLGCVLAKLYKVVFLKFSFIKTTITQFQYQSFVFLLTKILCYLGKSALCRLVNLRHIMIHDTRVKRTFASNIISFG